MDAQPRPNADPRNADTSPEGTLPRARPLEARPLEARSTTVALDKNHTRSVLMVGLADKCLDVEGPSNGAPVRLFECHGRPNQRWDLERINRSGEIHDSASRCLQPDDDHRLVVDTCESPGTRWDIEGSDTLDFRLIHRSTGLCMDVADADATDSTPVQLFECHDGANQIWHYERVTCTSGRRTLCLSQGRFEVEIVWRDFLGQSGDGRAVAADSDDSGLFWFFSRENWEMQVKVLDGCGINDHFWVFAAATTNVGYTLRVTDTETGLVRGYENPLGNAAPALTDTFAFASCEF